MWPFDPDALRCSFQIGHGLGHGLARFAGWHGLRRSRVSGVGAGDLGLTAWADEDLEALHL